MVTISSGRVSHPSASLGASHQTGWNGVIEKLIERFDHLDGRQFLEAGKAGAFKQA